MLVVVIPFRFIISEQADSDKVSVVNNPKIELQPAIGNSGTKFTY